MHLRTGSERHRAAVSVAAVIGAVAVAGSTAGALPSPVAAAPDSSTGKQRVLVACEPTPKAAIKRLRRSVARYERRRRAVQRRYRSARRRAHRSLRGPSMAARRVQRGRRAAREYRRKATIGRIRARTCVRAARATSARGRANGRKDSPTKRPTSTSLPAPSPSAPIDGPESDGPASDDSSADGPESTAPTDPGADADGAKPVGIEGTIRWRSGSNLVDTVARLRSAGMAYTRESIAWYRVEPSKGRWEWRAVDEWVGEAARQGLKVVAILDGPPAWATGTTDTKVAPVSGQPLADYATYARKVVERYGTRGTFWEEHPSIPKLPITEWNVWNEPYMRWFWHNSGTHPWPDAAGYAQMFKAVVQEARKAGDPEAKFMAEVEISSDDANNQLFLSRMFDAVPDLGQYMDAASAHPYVHTDGRSPEVCSPATDEKANRYNFCRLKKIREILDRRGAEDASLWVTEMGWSTCPICSQWQVSDEVYAQHIRDTFRLLRDWNIVDGLIWWKYDTGEADPAHPQDWFGMVGADGSPKVSWQAYVDEAARGI